MGENDQVGEGPATVAAPVKGEPVKQLRATITKVLDKVDVYLQTEPARLIGYGAAVVVFLVAQVVGRVRPGLLPDVPFETAIAITGSAIVFLTVVVENIRRFVYAPMTYIEDLADESKLSHEAAHLEEEFSRSIEQAMARRDAELAAAQQPQKTTMTVGSARGKNATSDKLD